jgi:hypothetical protein
MSEDHLSIKVGPDLDRILEDALSTNTPLMIAGPTGVGKSTIVGEFCIARSLSFRSLDLSVMDPPEIQGMPLIDGDWVRYAKPFFWPRDEDEEGVLLFEEVNRAAEFVRTPMLELLTRRRVNDHILPKGVLPVACINPAGGDYHVDDLDPALENRFMYVDVEAGLEEWVFWACDHGVHPAIIRYVEQTPDVFTAHPKSNPRSWTMASNHIDLFENSPNADQRLLTVKLAGLVGKPPAISFMRSYIGKERWPLPREIIADYPSHRSQMRKYLANGMLDKLLACLEGMKRYLKKGGYQHLLADPEAKRNVEMFFEDLAPDLKRKLRVWIRENGFVGLRVPQTRRAPLPK